MVTKRKLRHDLTLDALGHATRREILALLRRGAMPVGAIAERLPVTRPAVSKHLRILRQAGLVDSVTAGNRHLFRLDPRGFETARDYIDRFWNVALDNFQRLAEREARQHA